VVQGPGSGSVVLLLAMGTVSLPTADTYTAHLYMTSQANSSANGGSGNDWNVSSAATYYTVTVVQAYTNSLTVITAPSTIPSSGSFSVQCAWSSTVTGLINLHLDLSDITQAYAYDGGASVQVSGPGAGLVTLTLPEIGSLSSGDKYQLHTYMTSQANSTLYGSNNDWSHSFYDQYYSVTVGGSSSDSSSSKSLSGGAIAGIVIGVLAGVAILAVILFFLVCGSTRSFKSSKMDDNDQGAGSHERHEDEQSQVGESQAGDIEMGETHHNEDNNEE